MNNVFNEKLKEELERNEEVCLWMSFSDNDGFKGVIVTKAFGLSHAIQKTHEMGINPSGEIMSDVIEADTVNPEDFDRLLSKVELIEAGYINKLH